MGKALSRILHWNSSSNAVTFEKLPEVCQLKIFGFLTITEKGIAAQVCRHWNSLLKSPVLWSYLDLTVFKLHPREELLPKKHVCSTYCYNIYKARLNSFHMFVINVAPSIRLLRFAFDIGDVDDDWLEWIQVLLMRVRCCDLANAAISWRDTAVWPKEESFCLVEDIESVRRARHRQRLFVGFFEYFVSLSPNLLHLELEFDWSLRSVEALARLQRLETLALKRYFALQTLDQKLVDRVLDSLPRLRRLEIEVWTPNSTGLCQYAVKSGVLQHLDIASSRGFCLVDLHLPRARSIRMSRHPWNGPLVTIDCAPLPCVYHVLVSGAPDLCEINGHRLQPEWKTCLYPELISVLEAVCSCHLHAVIPTSCVK